MNYEIGKFYPLEVTPQCTTVIGGTPYILVKDEEKEYTIKPFEYQIEYSIFPKTLSCFVKKITANGRVYFEQSKEDALREMYYHFGELHEFKITEVKYDESTGATYYTISDVYGFSQRFYPDMESKLKRERDTVWLLVEKIIPAQKGKNNARLELKDPGTAPETCPTERISEYPAQDGKKYFGQEDDRQEFKSSIVYPAGSTEADIDKQLAIICRTIAGFMNKDGGTLYIGVSDDGYVRGIQDDYGHLNDGEDTRTYKENDDHYLLKITNALCDHLTNYAGSLVNMEIKSDQGLKYCEITIKKAGRPIWFDGTKLFSRVVCSNRLFKNDEVTQFILDRTTKEGFMEQQRKEADNPTISKSTPAPDTAAPVKVQSTTKLSTTNSAKAWRHIAFHQNGSWSFQKDYPNGQDVVYVASVPADAKQNSLLLVVGYEDGHVDVVDLKKALYGTRGLLPEGTTRIDGWKPENGRIVNAFCAKRGEMLLITGNRGKTQIVKALSVNTLGIHDKMGNRGNDIAQDKTVSIEHLCRVPDIEGNYTAVKGCGIFIEKNQKYTKGWITLEDLAPIYIAMINRIKDNSTSQVDSNDIKESTGIKEDIDNHKAFENRIEEIRHQETGKKPSLLVIFPDGTFIHDNSAVGTFWKVIHQIGIENVKNLGIAARQGRGTTLRVPLIGTKIYNDTHKILTELSGQFENGTRLGDKSTQIYVDGYCVFVKYSIGQLESLLNRISRELGLNLHIEQY